METDSSRFCVYQTRTVVRSEGSGWCATPKIRMLMLVVMLNEMPQQDLSTEKKIHQLLGEHRMSHWDKSKLFSRFKLISGHCVVIEGIEQFFDMFNIGH